MSKIHEAAKQSLEFAKEMMKKYADAHQGPTPVYTVGQKVWLEGKNISSLRPSQKLDDQRYGPFEIIKKVSPTAYQLKLPANGAFTMFSTSHSFDLSMKISLSTPTLILVHLQRSLMPKNNGQWKGS